MTDSFAVSLYSSFPHGTFVVFVAQVPRALEESVDQVPRACRADSQPRKLAPCFGRNLPKESAPHSLPTFDCRLKIHCSSVSVWLHWEVSCLRKSVTEFPVERRSGEPVPACINSPFSAEETEAYNSPSILLSAARCY